MISKKTWILIVIGIIVMAGIVVALVFLLGGEEAETDDSAISVSKVSYTKVMGMTITQNNNVIDLVKTDGVWHHRNNEDVSIDPQRQEHIQSELDIIYALMQKFNASDIDELIAIRADIEGNLLKLDNYSNKIDEASKAVSRARETLFKKMNTLSQKRKAAIPEFQKAVCRNLKAVNLEEALFSVDIDDTHEPGKDGGNTVRFLFSANKGAEPAELNRVASGGELSRLMLSIKAVLTQKETLPTIIFDEIQSGVSGVAAGKIADLLRAMGSSMQVIAITHLPQVAAKSKAQYQVYKNITGNKTYSNIKQLSYEERISELSVMLSDGNVSVQAVENAKALLKNS